jgi:hypothetical protein
MEKQHIDITITDATKRLEIVHVSREQEKNLVPYQQSGNISIVRCFLRGRICFSDDLETKNSYVNELRNAVILISPSQRSIRFIENVHTPYNMVNLIGSLKLNTEIDAMRINQVQVLNIEDLKKLLRLRRHLFDKQEDFNEVFAALQKLRVVTSNTQVNAKDERGNSDKAHTVQVTESNVPLNFTLKAPIFETGNECTFAVEICYEVRSAGIDFWLESSELLMLIDRESREMMKREIDEMSHFPIPCLYV